MAGSVGKRMNKTLGHTPLVEVLAPSIKDDAVIKAAAHAVDAALLPVVNAIPRMLLWARLWQDERGLSPSLSRIVHFCGGLPPLSDEELELLAWQMHVDFWDPAWPRSVREHLVKYSTAWHRIKGTPASVRNALSLFGYQADIEENGPGRWWATYQMGLPALASMDDVRQIVSICNEMAPARSRLWRIYTSVYDWRPGVWSDGLPDNAWSECWWSWYSGVHVPDIPGLGDDGLLISFGRMDRYQVEMYGTGGVGWGMEERTGILIPYIDRPIWSRSQWGATHPLNSGFVVGELFGLHWCEKITSSAPWAGAWDARHWVESILWDRILPAWNMARRSWCKAQSVHSWPGAQIPDGRDGAYGDINACYGVPVCVISGQPPRWGAFAYSEEDHQRREIPILEQFHDVSRATTPPFRAGDALPVVFSTDVLRAAPVHNVDRPVWGVSRWGDDFAVYLAQHYIGLSTLSVQSGERQLAPQAWVGTWDTRPWARTIGWGHILPAWSMAIKDWPLSQSVFSGGAAESSACYGVPTATITGTPSRWGDGVYSDNIPERIEITITERQTVHLTVTVAPVRPGQPQTALYSQEA